METVKLFTAVMKKLMELSGRIQSGKTAQVTVPGNSYKDISVKFTKAFSKVPIVIPCLNSTSTSSDIGNITVAVTEVTTTGCTLRVFNAGSSNRAPVIYWLAEITIGGLLRRYCDAAERWCCA